MFTTSVRVDSLCMMKLFLHFPDVRYEFELDYPAVLGSCASRVKFVRHSDSDESARCWIIGVVPVGTLPLYLLDETGSGRWL